MAFGNITALYIPTVTNAGSSQWGTNVRALLDTADAASGTNTTMNHSTGGAVTRTVMPYAASTTDADQTLYGWAVTPTDMNSVAGAKRFFAAGDHVGRFWLSQNTILSVSATLHIYVYRVGPAPTRTRTQLGHGQASVTIPASGSSVFAGAGVTLPEIVFEEDETVQYSFELNATGVAISGRIVTATLGTSASEESRIDTPLLGVLAETTGAAAGVGSAAGTSGYVLGTSGTAAGAATLAGVGASTGAGAGDAAGAGSASGSASSVAGATGAATASATAAGQASIVLGTTGTVEIGSVSGDFAGSDPSKTISGTVYDAAGAPVSGSTVKLFRQSDDLQVASTTSDAAGTYTFTRDAADPNSYYAIAYSDATHHGTTDRDLAPV